jgi:chromosome segregation protein
MHGFKSFPRKTEIPFTEGINVILGPNGSGKSNVSDALCFVLGRLSIKSMRAAKARNLIFLGTKAVGPAKEASVEIVFDNSNRTFSIDKNELSIKRTVRRSGQQMVLI